MYNVARALLFKKTRRFRTSRIDLLEAQMRGSEGGLDDLCRRGAPGSTVTTTPRPAMRPTCDVVVPSGCLVRCLRGDMAASLVFEV